MTLKNAQQAQAIEFLDDWFYNQKQVAIACLQGYAGTGKTWLTGFWTERLLEAKPAMRITIMAPTNKALDVLRSKCGHLNVDFRTIDSFLGNKIRKNDDGETEKTRTKGAENPDLIICDEASMIKEEYAIDLQRRGVRLLYVGDPAQLPPINEDLSTAFKIEHKFVMTEVVRYDGAIIKVATMLRERIESKEMFVLSDILGFRDAERSLSCIKLDDIHSWALQAHQKNLDARIVAFTNIDVNRHNAIMHRSLFPQAELFGVGERALVNETFELPKMDPDSEETDMLYNGETLTVVSCVRNPTLECGVVTFAVGFVRSTKNLEINGVEQPKAEYVLDVALDEGHALAVHKELTNQIWQMRRNGSPESEVKKLIELRKPLNKLAPLRHSYACTVHKSQGSTYDVCFVDWASVYRSPDRARMMYVAATRPSKYLVVASK